MSGENCPIQKGGKIDRISVAKCYNKENQRSSEAFGHRLVSGHIVHWHFLTCCSSLLLFKDCGLPVEQARVTIIKSTHPSNIERVSSRLAGI